MTELFMQCLDRAAKLVPPDKVVGLATEMHLGALLARDHQNQATFGDLWAEDEDDEAAPAPDVGALFEKSGDADAESERDERCGLFWTKTTCFTKPDRQFEAKAGDDGMCVSVTQRCFREGVTLNEREEAALAELLTHRAKARAALAKAG